MYIMNITINYKESNLVDDGNTDGLIAMSTSDYWVVDGYNSAINQLTDGSTGAYNMWWNYVSNGPFTFVVSFDNPTLISAFEVVPATGYTNWTVKTLTVETSKDWITWTKQGEITNSSANIANANPFVVRFTKPVNCQYIRLTNIKANSSRTLAIGELNVYQ
mgnify:FL=1